LRAAQLTPAQRKSILDIRNRHDAQMRGFGRRIIDKRRELVDALEESTPNVERARVALRELSATIAEQVAARTIIELEVFRLLTSEQRARVRAFRDEQAKAKLRGRAGAAEVAPHDDAEPESDDDPLASEDGARTPDDARDAGNTRAPRTRDRAQRVRPLVEIDFTPDQRAKIRELRRRQMPALRAVVGRFRETRQALTETLLASTIDEDRVKQLGVELGRLEADRTRLRFDAEVSLLSLMTPDQIRQYRELQRDRRRAADARPADRGLDTP